MILVCEHCLGEFQPKPRGPRNPRFCAPLCQHKQWTKDNPERIRELWRTRYWRNREAKLDYVKEYALLNPDVNKRAQKKFAKTDKGRVSAIKQSKAHRARRLGADGSHTDAEFLQMVEYFDSKCLCCGETSEYLTEDHVVSLSRGGSDSIENIQPLCMMCNRIKHAKTIDYRPKDFGYHPILGQSVIASVSEGTAPVGGSRAVP